MSVKRDYLLRVCETCGGLMWPSSTKGYCFCPAANGQGCTNHGLHVMTVAERRTAAKAVWLEQFPSAHQANHVDWLITGHSGRWHKTEERPLRCGSRVPATEHQGLVYACALHEQKVYAFVSAESNKTKTFPCMTTPQSNSSS